MASAQPECIPDPVYPRPATSPISGGGDVPQVPAEVAGRDEVVVCPEKGDEEEQREGTNKKEKANLKYGDETECSMNKCYT